jgi:hypothetical protein
MCVRRAVESLSSCMCAPCGTATITYASVYEELWKSPDRREWLHKKLIEAEHLCMHRRLRLICILNIAFETQGAFERLKTDAFIKERIRQAVKTAQLIKTHRTRRLARKMLAHSYRPSHGRMFSAHMRRCPLL